MDPSATSGEIQMTSRELAVWIIAIVACVSIIGLIVYGSIERTRLKADAAIVRSQEVTKRAGERHQLLDFFGLLRKDKPDAR